MRRGSAEVVLVVVVMLCGLVGVARADRAFTPRFSTNASGDIAIVGNTLETCPSSAADCANARAGLGTVLDNNSFATERVNVDPTMLDSSSARLTLPTGARVLFAGLYYGGRTTAGTRGKAAPDASLAGLRKVDLRVPGGAGFSHLTGEVDQSTDVTGAYGGFVDVTALVQRGGSGEYTVANVQSATGEDRYAGWALVVAYEAPGDPPRNLTVFDGLQSVTQSKRALTIPVSGFQTPLSGPVRTRLGFVAYEGDRGLTGDGATLDGKAITDPLNPANNLFNSVISVDGKSFTDKTPDYINQLGFDAKLIRIDGVLANGATSASIALRTSSDQYLPQVVTFATDLYAPVIHATKTVENLTHPDGPTGPGDRLRYTVAYKNDGLEAATNFVAVDDLPADTTYQPGSLRIVGIPAAEATPTDLPGDDLGEYDPAQHAVRFYLGSGASPDHGGVLAVAGAPGDQAQISFEVRVDDTLPAEREIRNVAQATFIAPTLGTQLSALSSEATLLATPGPMSSEPADLALAQSETVAPAASGDDGVDDQITIQNNGPGDATDVLLDDLVPADATVESATVDQGSCTVSSTEVMCDVSRLDAGGSATADVVILEPAGDAVAGSLDEATVSASQFDPTPVNDSTAVIAPMPPPAGPIVPTADLDISDQQSAQEVALGATLTETIKVVNDGPDAATGVDLTDALTGAAQLVDLHPGTATCSSEAPLNCTFARIPSGASEEIELTLRPLSPGLLTDAATVSADELDPDYANNTTRIATTVRPRRTAARVRIVPIEPLTTPGHTVGFVVTIAAAPRTPAVLPAVCVTLPKRLRLLAAAGATVDGRRVCWARADLVSGQPRSFELRATVGPPPSGASLTVTARLAGMNFDPREAAAVVQVLPHFVACPSSVPTAPRARIAC
ncbi:MAG: hypothetical protein ACLPV4_09010 [Solirubrobacteraceae bacterium]